jgi:hypothetical protein
MDENTGDFGIEPVQPTHNGKPNAKMMTNTGTNFFARFGDRLPTRETKSRKGRLNYITS